MFTFFFCFDVDMTDSVDAAQLSKLDDCSACLLRGLLHWYNHGGSILTFFLCLTYDHQTLHKCTFLITEFRPDRTSNMADRGGAIRRKTFKVHFRLNLGCIIAKFLLQVHLMTIHEISLGFFIWPIFQGHRGQSWKKLQTWHVFSLFDLGSPKALPKCTPQVTEFRPDQTSNMADRGDPTENL